jgi:hypothetical protein
MYIEQEEYVERVKRTIIGRKNLTNDERVLIGTLSKLEGPRAAAEITGVSPNTANKLADGIVSESIGVVPELKNAINAKVKATVDNVKDSLLDGITLAIEEMKENLVNTTKPQEAAATAKMLAETFEKISGRVVTSNSEGNRVQVIINAPAMKKENDYEVIEAVVTR